MNALVGALGCTSSAFSRPEHEGEDWKRLTDGSDGRACSFTSVPLVNASVVVHGVRGTMLWSNFTPHIGTTFGDFYRPLGPGRYTVRVNHPGFVAHTENINIPRRFLRCAQASPSPRKKLTSR
jgi:hypothetical protein